MGTTALVSNFGKDIIAFEQVAEHSYRAFAVNGPLDYQYAFSARMPAANPQGTLFGSPEHGTATYSALLVYLTCKNA